MQSHLIALLLSWTLCLAVQANDFHFGEPNGAALGAKIEDGRLVYALKNSTDRPWKYMVRIQAQVPMYDNLILIVIDEAQIIHRFGFVDSRDKSIPIFKTLLPGELFQDSIDLSDWDRRNWKNRGFNFQEGQSYRVYLHYFWVQRQGSAEIQYGPIDSQLFKITIKNGIFTEVKD